VIGADKSVRVIVRGVLAPPPDDRVARARLRQLPWRARGSAAAARPVRQVLAAPAEPVADRRSRKEPLPNDGERQ